METYWDKWGLWEPLGTLRAMNWKNILITRTRFVRLRSGQAKGSFKKCEMQKRIKKYVFLDLIERNTMHCIQPYWITVVVKSAFHLSAKLGLSTLFFSK